MVADILRRYYAKLSIHLNDSQLRVAASATTYRQLIETLLIPLAATADDFTTTATATATATTPTTFESFQQQTACSLQEIDSISRPFLMLMSTNDPLHHPDLTGVPAALAASQCRRSRGSDNVAYFVTNHGGHVHFPSGGLTGSSFLRDVLPSFATAAASEAFPYIDTLL